MNRVKTFLLVLFASMLVAVVPAANAGTAPAGSSAVKKGKGKKKTKKTKKVPAGAFKGALAPLSGKGRWFVDRTGRVVQLRGVNEVSKHAPYYPAADGFGADDAALLARHGFNVVRLGVDFQGLMPEPGQPSETYISNLAKTVNVLTRAGIYTLVDFHQDGFSPKYNGNGFPDWWAVDDGLSNPNVYFPVYYLLNPAMQRAFEHFWMNTTVEGKGLQDWFIQGLLAVVKKFRSNSHVIGYETFNEPWPGADYSACYDAETGCPDLERERIMPFARKVVAATRKLTKRQQIFVEPFVTYNFGTPTSLPGSTGASLAVHNYAVSAEGDAKVVEQSVKAARRDSKPVVLTEFGATGDTAKLDRLTSLYDGGLMSWIFWAYNENLVTEESTPNPGSVVNQPVLQALTRPYPVALTGKPTSLSFDPATRVMSLKFKTARTGGGKFIRRLPSVIATQKPT